MLSQKFWRGVLWLNQSSPAVDFQQAHTSSHSRTCKILSSVISRYIRLPAHVPSYRILLGVCSFEWLAVRAKAYGIETMYQTELILWSTMERTMFPFLSRRKWSVISWESSRQRGNLSSGSKLPSTSYSIILVVLCLVYCQEWD